MTNKKAEDATLTAAAYERKRVRGLHLAEQIQALFTEADTMDEVVFALATLMGNLIEMLEDPQMRGRYRLQTTRYLMDIHDQADASRRASEAPPNLQ